MKGFVCCTFVLLVLALGACGNASTSAAPPTRAAPPKQPTYHYVAYLSALNGSGVSGTVDLQLAGNRLAVTVNVTGLTPNQIHFQHIHGSHNGVSTCPTRADAGANGIITVDRALKSIGPVALGFGPYTPADKDGVVRWSRTFTLDRGILLDLTPLVQHVVVFRGMIYQGSYDNVLPAACGPIQAM